MLKIKRVNMDLQLYVHMIPTQKHCKHFSFFYFGTKDTNYGS